MIARQQPKEAIVDSPFEQGVDAYNFGRGILANPYPEDDRRHAEWTTGWHAAEARARD